jgi:signal transduction histidine kinase
MIKKNEIVLGVLILISFAWSEWIILPKYGTAILLLTIPLYAVFIGIAWHLAYTLAKKRSGEQVRQSMEYARVAVNEMTKVMKVADSRRDYSERLYEDANRLNQRNRKQLEEISAQRNVMAEEAEILDALIQRHRPCEEMELRLKNSEKERLYLKSALKRVKKAMQLDNIQEDTTEIH